MIKLTGYGVSPQDSVSEGKATVYRGTRYLAAASDRVIKLFQVFSLIERLIWNSYHL